MTRRLFVSPHPDDAEMGCGAAIHMLRRKEMPADIAVCAGEGMLTMAHSGETVPFDYRVKEQLDAAEALGGPKVHFLNVAPASRFDTVPQVDFVNAFDKLFRDYDRVYLPLPSYNADHAVVWRAGLAAFRPGKLDGVDLYAYEQACSNCLAETSPGMFGRAYVEVDEKAVIAKCASIGCHKSQVNGRATTIYGSGGALELARLRGLECGSSFAELYYVVRKRITI